MAFPVVTRTTGEFITPAIWNADLKDNINFIRPIVARNTVDQPVASNTSLQLATSLSFAIAASEVWAVELRCVMSIPGTPDAKIHWSVPSGATGHHWYVGGSSRQTIANDIVLVGTGGDLGFSFAATIINSTNAGTVQFQFCQNTSDPSAVTLYANSVLIANRIA